MGTLPAQRLPACAGRFYEGTPERLREQVHALLEPDAPRVAAPAIICPHAGLMYSGAVAGAVMVARAMRTARTVSHHGEHVHGAAASEACRRLMMIPGVGHLTALAFLDLAHKQAAALDPLENRIGQTEPSDARGVRP